MPTATFTVRWIERLTSEGKQAYFWDVRQQGFGLRLSPPAIEVLKAISISQFLGWIGSRVRHFFF